MVPSLLPKFLPILAPKKTSFHSSHLPNLDLAIHLSRLRLTLLLKQHPQIIPTINTLVALTNLTHRLHPDKFYTLRLLLTYNSNNGSIMSTL